MGGMVALVAIIGAMVLIAIGKSVEGLALVILEAAGVAAVFLKTRAEGGKELQAKRRQAAEAKALGIVADNDPAFTDVDALISSLDAD